MRRFAVLFAVFWLSLLHGGANAQFSMLQVAGGVPPPNPAVTCDITTGVATGVGAGICAVHPATCNGVADDSPTLVDANAWAVGTWQASHSGLIEYLVPPGKSCNFAGTSVTCNVLSAQGCPFINIKSLIVVGYGSSAVFGSGTISLGGLHLFDGGTARRSTRLATVNAGDSCLNVLTPAQASIFTPGNYAMISGFDMQGTWHNPGSGFGFPPNPYYHENIKVASVDTVHSCSGAAGGSVTLVAPVAYTYLSTWPLYDPGAGANGINDQGGPATLYVVDPSWDSSVEFRGFTSLIRTGNQAYIKSRVGALTDLTMTGSNCVIPTEGESFTYTNVTGPSCNLEIDKLNGTITWNGGSVDIILFQSSSTELFNASDLTVTSFNGSPKKFSGTRVTMGSVIFGATSFGRTNEWTCASCVVNSINSGLGVNEFGALSAGTWALSGQGAGPYNATMSGGIITVPNTHGAVTWAVPGTNVAWRGTTETAAIFQIVAVTQDATNTYVQTSLAGGFPTIALSGGSLGISVLGAPKFTCTGCTGTEPQIASLTQAPAAAPLYSWQTYTYTGALGAAVQPGFHQWGNLSQLNMNVTTAYTGAGSLTFSFTRFNNLSVILSDQSTGLYNNAGGGPKVNAKSAGNRQVTLSGVTCVSGTCTGDSGMAAIDPSVMWFSGSPGSVDGVIFSADASASCPGAGCPSVTVTVQTNQGVINPPN